MSTQQSKHYAFAFADTTAQLSWLPAPITVWQWPIRVRIKQYAILDPATTNLADYLRLPDELLVFFCAVPIHHERAFALWTDSVLKSSTVSEQTGSILECR